MTSKVVRPKLKFGIVKKCFEKNSVTALWDWFQISLRRNRVTFSEGKGIEMVKWIENISEKKVGGVMSIQLNLVLWG